MSNVQHDQMMADLLSATPAVVPFVVYDPASGRIVQCGACPPDDLAFQSSLHPGHAVLEGFAPSYEGYVVRDGAIVVEEYRFEDEGV